LVPLGKPVVPLVEMPLHGPACVEGAPVYVYARKPRHVLGERGAPRQAEGVIQNVVLENPIICHCRKEIEIIA